MAKFVEVHCDSEAVLLNLDKVDCIFHAGSGSGVSMRGGAQKLDESYEEMRQLIGAAQGGVPMEPGRTYDGA